MRGFHRWSRFERAGQRRGPLSSPPDSSCRFRRRDQQGLSSPVHAAFPVHQVRRTGFLPPSGTVSHRQSHSVRGHRAFPSSTPTASGPSSCFASSRHSHGPSAVPVFRTAIVTYRSAAVLPAGRQSTWLASHPGSRSMNAAPKSYARGAASNRALQRTVTRPPIGASRRAGSCQPLNAGR